jgi:hypothetical protein
VNLYSSALAKSQPLDRLSAHYGRNPGNPKLITSYIISYLNPQAAMAFGLREAWILLAIGVIGITQLTTPLKIGQRYLHYANKRARCCGLTPGGSQPASYII